MAPTGASDLLSSARDFNIQAHPNWVSSPPSDLMDALFCGFRPHYFLFFGSNFCLAAGLSCCIIRPSEIFSVTKNKNFKFLPSIHIFSNPHLGGSSKTEIKVGAGCWGFFLFPLNLSPAIVAISHSFSIKL